MEHHQHHQDRGHRRRAVQPPPGCLVGRAAQGAEGAARATRREGGTQKIAGPERGAGVDWGGLARRGLSRGQRNKSDWTLTHPH
eukprot:scaffold2314_cov367-Prasinococcus_capsulatus_cf.AAC.5